MTLSVGVKVTLYAAVPTAGIVAGVVKAKVPAGVATPPVRVAEVSVCP